jgi:hypothetical protein
MVKTKSGFCSTSEVWPAVATLPVDDLPPALQDYLQERRRAIITELRMIEQMLNMRPSIPLRDRPH